MEWFRAGRRQAQADPKRESAQPRNELGAAGGARLGVDLVTRPLHVETVDSITHEMQMTGATSAVEMIPMGRGSRRRSGPLVESR